ncbi:MAG: peptidase domain-containing ABC transporter [Limnospira maxima]|uniref:ABC transporter ATP-binding protein n=4 Tax=Limnospira TaxID=2596745 RepID=A0A9P1NWF2_9CYAN|nr:peptidase domain-containing ABC transporter [Limnospira indica]CDM92452.1 ABC transporter ATP-binding protein [Limnospira indica PCC 8005]
MQKYPIVLQHSEEDCGAACLATITKYYKRTFTMSRIREAVGTGQQGTTILGLRRGAEELGFNASAGRASQKILEQMNKFPLPAIIHWQGYHWVVLYGKKGRKYVIADPAVGVRYLSKAQLANSWGNGVMLRLEPDQNRFFSLPDDSDKPNGFLRFFKRVIPYGSLLAEALIINLVLGLLSLASPFFIQILTDDVLVRGDMQLLTGAAIAIVILSLIQSSLGLVQSNLIAHFAQRLELGFVLEFGRKILYLPLNYYESRRSGEIVSRLGDISEVNQLVSQVVVELPSQLFVAIISLCFMLFYSWQLTLAAIIVAILMSISTIILLPTLQQKTRSVLVLGAENQGVLVETFKGAMTLKTTNAAPQVWEEFQSRFGRLANITLRTTQISIYNNVLSGLVSSGGSIALLWLGSRFVINNELSIGQLLAFNAMNGNFTGFISTVITFVDNFVRARTATQRLTEVIDATAENPNDSKKESAQISDGADIICNNLNFHHAGRVNLLTDFSVTIPGGQVTALIGKSGCGKSTLAKLISSLYPLQSGNIRIGHYNIQDLPLDCLRQQIILVPQDAHFWSRSILENFKFCYPHVTLAEIVTACEMANADEFISQLPDKYQTVLGEFGANLSGGEKQRLAIARAIVTNPPILILDESTGALDPAGEAEVLDRLLHYRQGKTTIMISHRPPVINRASWIVLLDNGKLKFTGTPEQLRTVEGQHLDLFPE